MAQHERNRACNGRDAVADSLLPVPLAARLRFEFDDGADVTGGPVGADGWPLRHAGRSEATLSPTVERSNTVRPNHCSRWPHHDSAYAAAHPSAAIRAVAAPAGREVPVPLLIRAYPWWTIRTFMLGGLPRPRTP